MPQPKYFSASFGLPSRVTLSALFSLAAMVWVGLSGCKPVEISDPAKDTVITTDSASITIFNNIEQDPQAIVFYLFNGNAFDIVNANKVKRLGEIEYGQSASVKVPVGTWKLAYETEAGVLLALEAYDAEDIVWVKSIFEKDLNYALILSTDGNRTVWGATFTTIPGPEG